MPWPILLLSLLLSGPLLVAAEDEPDLAKAPEMSPENCARRPPEKLYLRLLTKEHHVDGVSSSQASQDDFCFIYQQQLQKFVDAHYPSAGKYRKGVQAAFHGAMHFIEALWDPWGLKHEDERLEAQVEWIIYQGAKRYFAPDENGVCTPSGVEQYALVMAGKFGTGPSFDDRALPYLHEAIDQLTKATVDEGAEERHARWYFSHELYRFLKSYSKRPE